MEGKPNQLYAQGMRSFEQYNDICKYFVEGKQRDNNANEIQKHLQLHNVNVGEYLTDKYALWLDFKTIDKHSLQGTGRRIENASEGIILQIEKKEELAGPLNAYIYLIMDAQLNVENGTYVLLHTKVCFKSFVTQIIKLHNFFNICSKGIIQSVMERF